MRSLFAKEILLAACLLAATVGRAQAQPDQTVRSADQILHEVMVIPARQIPEALLREAQGVAVIPDVIKIGFIAGIRRGHGIVMVRDNDGQWSLPQFVTLTGGSVGWQAGVQGTDVVLVFMTKKSVEGMLRGKFTIGADASAAAGPVGRDAAAATDIKLKAEILSYSRSRGLFVGLSLDGSALEIDPDAQIAYYGSQPGQVPLRVPESAIRLREDLVNLTPSAIAVAAPVEAAAPPTEAKLSALRRSLAKEAVALQAIVDDTWKKYLALPADVFEERSAPRVDLLRNSLAQYDRVAQGAKYKALASRPEFTSTHELLREYVRALEQPAGGPRVALPPPPGS